MFFHTCILFQGAPQRGQAAREVERGRVQLHMVHRGQRKHGRPRGHLLAVGQVAAAAHLRRAPRVTGAAGAHTARPPSCGRPGSRGRAPAPPPPRYERYGAHTGWPGYSGRHPAGRPTSTFLLTHILTSLTVQRRCSVSRGLHAAERVPRARAPRLEPRAAGAAPEAAVARPARRSAGRGAVPARRPVRAAAFQRPEARRLRRRATRARLRQHRAVVGRSRKRRGRPLQQPRLQAVPGQPPVSWPAAAACKRACSRQAGAELWQPPLAPTFVPATARSRAPPVHKLLSFRPAAGRVVPVQALGNRCPGRPARHPAPGASLSCSERGGALRRRKDGPLPGRLRDRRGAARGSFGGCRAPPRPVRSVAWPGVCPRRHSGRGRRRQRGAAMLRRRRRRRHGLRRQRRWRGRERGRRRRQRRVLGAQQERAHHKALRLGLPGPGRAA